MFRAKIQTDNGKVHINQLQELVEDFNEQWELMKREMSRVDRAISDIHHFIEISPGLNAAEGYKAYKDLKDLLELRREVKNNWQQMQPFKAMLDKSNINWNRLNQISNNIQDIIDRNDSDRIYRTRILKNEFGKVIK